ncbi:MAG: hypothetical protein Q8T09_17550 [Candidatus Melainabacteria bacterium]|nr:hypothetical protein [Candidatus Melainabacteria bacterium]
MAVGRSNASNHDKVPKKYPARLYQADSGEPISALVSVQGDDLLISAIDGEHLHKFEAAKYSASGDSISFLLSSLQVKGGGSEGDKVVLIEPESQATVIINSHDFLGELRAVMPAKQIKGNFQRLKFNRLQASFRNGLVAVFIAGAVLLFAFVVVSGFLYESKHPHRDDVSLTDEEGEAQEARPPSESSTEAVEPVSEEYAVTYYDSEEMSEEANQALTKYLTAFRTKTQSKLRKFIAKPMANGTVVELAVGANGNLVNSCIAQSAGVSNDKLVLKVVRASFPLQPLPKGVQSPIRAKILLK